MQAVSLYWFAAQQQTSTLRQQNNGLFDAKFSADFNKLVFSSKGNRKCAKKWLKPIGVVRRLRLKRQVQSLREVPKGGSLIIF